MYSFVDWISCSNDALKEVMSIQVNGGDFYSINSNLFTLNFNNIALCSVMSG